MKWILFTLWLHLVVDAQCICKITTNYVDSPSACTLKVPVNLPLVEIKCDMTNAVLLCYKMNCTKLCDSIRQTWQQKQSFIGCPKDTIVPTRQPTKPTTRFLFPTLRPSTKKPSSVLVPTSKPTVFIFPVPSHSPPTILRITTSSPTSYVESNHTTTSSAASKTGINLTLLIIIMLLWLVAIGALIYLYVRWRCLNKQPHGDAENAYALL
jgi:hypothetical protein